MQEKETNVPLNRETLYVKTRTRKNGQPVNEYAAENIVRKSLRYVAIFICMHMIYNYYYF